ncbi:MAG TPA: hypothetical protein VF538_09335 [Pyrinomonadaceae bacterium]|jgi:hypothetical protein
MTPFTSRAAPFVAPGIAFLAIGLSGSRAFIYVGIVFMLIGIIRGRGARRISFAEDKNRSWQAQK